MKLKSIKPLLPFIFAGVLVMPDAALHADEVVLFNGDRFTGTVVNKEGKILVFSTEYAGELRIRWEEVRQLSSDTPAWIYFEDGTRVNATLEFFGDGTVVLTDGDGLQSTPMPVEAIMFINPSPEVSGEGVKISGRVNAGLSSTSGNTEAETLWLSGESIARTRDNRFTLGAQGRRTKDRGRVTESNWLAFLKYDHFLTTKWYTYANGNFENDKFRDIRLRSTLGLGSGYQFFESDRTNLFLEGGLTYVNTDYDLGQDEDYPAGRWALKYDHYLGNSRTQFFHSHEAYVGLEDQENSFVRSQTGFRFPLVQRLIATAQYNVDWDNQPAPGLVKTDRTWLLTLGYSW